MKSESQAPRALISISGRHSWGLVPHVPCPTALSSMEGSLSVGAFRHWCQRLCSCHCIRVLWAPQVWFILWCSLSWSDAIAKGEPVRANWRHLSLFWWKIALITTARKIFLCLQFLMGPILMILRSSMFWVDSASLLGETQSNLKPPWFYFRWGLILVYFFLKKWGMTFKHLRSCSLFQLCGSIDTHSCGMKLRD